MEKEITREVWVLVDLSLDFELSFEGMEEGLERVTGKAEVVFSYDLRNEGRQVFKKKPFVLVEVAASGLRREELRPVSDFVFRRTRKPAMWLWWGHCPGVQRLRVRPKASAR